MSDKYSFDSIMERLDEAVASLDKEGICSLEAKLGLLFDDLKYVQKDGVATDNLGPLTKGSEGLDASSPLGKDIGSMVGRVNAIHNKVIKLTGLVDRTRDLLDIRSTDAPEPGPDGSQ